MSEVQKPILEQAQEIPIGFCQCGCGGRTNISPKTNREKGLKKGMPYKFILGHAVRGRVRPEEEREKIRKAHTGPNHYAYKGSIFLARARKNGEYRWYVHIRSRSTVPYTHVVMEDKTGKPVPKGMIVHHQNNIETDDDPNNLELMTQSEHLKIHWAKGDFRNTGHKYPWAPKMIRDPITGRFIQKA